MFDPVAGSVKFPQLEARIGAFWREQRIYEKSLARRAGAPRFVFYEGPPTANGLPHPGHCLTRAIKDLFPRYRTMRGYLCERKAGWDTHGLPVEVEVCKELGIHSKEEIEAYGVEPFIHKCLESVFRYTQEWERLTERLGFWVDLADAYVTYHQQYVESVWWSLKTLFDRGLLYQGHKIVWWWAQGGTALSAGEVGQGYREVTDPSVYVKFPIVEDASPDSLRLPRGTSLLVWTTTPWTLFSNMFVAVNEAINYALVFDPDADEHLVIAESLVESLQKKFSKPNWRVTRRISGAALCANELGGTAKRTIRYRPPFHEVYYGKRTDQFVPIDALVELEEAVGRSLRAKIGDFQAPWQNPRVSSEFAWYVLPARFVTTDSGTGLVHIAPAFGEDDYYVWLNVVWDSFARPFNDLMLNPVAPNGRFTEAVPAKYRGRWVKDCDRDIIRELKQRGLLYHQEQYLHEYPFCWRSEEDPLIQYPRRSWFVRTREFKGRMQANNAQINWMPEHIKEGRFGNFLESNVDWALSRERYWGTPLPIWKCEKTGEMEAVGSYDDLLAKPGIAGTDVWLSAKAAHPELSEHLKVHKPYIDAVTYDSPFAQQARMRRVPEVIDCWYDSGAMPFAQWGYPHTGETEFKEQFPADFISEAIDQTRGWFYSQLAISTLLFGPHEPIPVAAAILAEKIARRGAQSDLPTGSASAGGDALVQPWPHSFRNCIVLGLMLTEWWESKDGKQVYLSEEEARAGCGESGFAQKVGKMSKSKRNYREPNEIFDRYGADALRWYFFANQPPWTSIRYSEQSIKDSIPEFLLRLWNVYSFFVIYAKIDGFDPAAALADSAGAAGSASLDQLSPAALATANTYRPKSRRGELDRWILGELAQATSGVVQRMDAYDNYGACGLITAYVDALSNWYVRRSRDRFWAEDKNDPDKLDAYWTLYECLLETSKLVAPFVPFLADALWQNLAVTPFGDRVLPSVHLCDYPAAPVAPASGGSQGPGSAVDARLSQRMALVREIVSLGRSARMGAKLKVRQPLAKVEVILVDRSELAWLETHVALIAEELNVHEVEFSQDRDQYISYTVLPDLKRLGPRVGKRLPALKAALAKADAAALLATLDADKAVSLDLPDGPVTLDEQDLQIRLQAKPGWAAAQGHGCVVVLATEITAELELEGIARELVHAIQNVRKDLNCEYTNRIDVGVVTTDAKILAAIASFGDYLTRETLIRELVFGPLAGVDPIEIKIGGAQVFIYIKVITS